MVLDLKEKKFQSLLVFFAGLAFAYDAFACSCMPREESGFVHASKTTEPAHLPSDARGALFLSPDREKIIAIEGDDIVVDGLPAPLREDEFEVFKRDKEGKRRLQVVIEPVNFPEEKKSDTSKRYFLPLNASIAECLRNPQRPQCGKGAILRDHEGWLKELIQNKKIEDVTEDFYKAKSRASGMFRIGVVGGFRPGETYEIVPPLGLPLNVAIDANPVGKGPPEFKIQADGLPVRKLLSISEGGSCSSSQPFTVQNLQYLLPPQYEPYRESLTYATRQKYLSGGWIAYGAEIGQFSSWTYQPSMCASPPFGKSVIGPGFDLVYSYCEKKDGLIPSSYVKGTVRFLEVSDDEFETPEIEIRFGQAKPASCDSVELLREAIKQDRQAEIEDHVCQLADSRFLDGKIRARYLPVLENLSGTASEKTRLCLSDALVNVRPEGVLPRTLMRALILRLEDADPAVRERASRTLFNFINGADIYIPGQVENLAIALPVFRTMLSDPNPAVRRSALATLHRLGPLSKDALPKMIELAKIEPRIYWDIYVALMTIDPNDSRVMKTVLEDAGKGLPNAVSALVNSAPDFRNRAVGALMNSMETSSKENRALAIDVLGKIGKNAQAAIALLIKTASTDNDNRLRGKAMISLASINAENPQILSVIVENILHPVSGKVSGREMAIEALGDMGKNGQAGFTALKDILNGELTSPEIDAIREALPKLKLPEDEADYISSRLKAIKPAAGETSAVFRNVTVKEPAG